jgi:outer membrane protein assembly factor BamB
MKRLFFLLLIYLGLFFFGYLGIGILLHFSRSSVRILPKFIERTLDEHWGVQQLNGTTSELKYELIGSIHQDTNVHIVFSDHYSDATGIFCFRGNAQRNAPTIGTLANRPQQLSVDWVFETDQDLRTTRLGTWGGGTGWTGQALVIDWPPKLKSKLHGVFPEFIQSSNNKEVIVGSLCGKIYFLDFLSGKPTRPALTISNPIKGTVSVDPRMNGLLYVGQGIPNGNRFGAYVFNMFTGEEVYYRPGLDADAFRNWGAFDSNCLIDKLSGYWFHPGENGMIYKTKVSSDGKFSSPVKFKYQGPMKSQGLEASFGAWNNLGFFGDNGGNVFCLNLMTMRPVWFFNNLDDTDAAMVLDIENQQPFLYVANEVDKQGANGIAVVRKLNAKTGAQLWSYGMNCRGDQLHGKTNSGGVLASVLPGKKKASGLVFSIFSRVSPTDEGRFVALDKATGKIKYQLKMDHYSWASPIDLYDQAGNCYVFFTDVFGTIYLIDGVTGKIIQKKKTDCIWESSPIAWGNRIVLGARGNRIFSFLVN